MTRARIATLITLGKLVKFCREVAGLKQATVASRLGYSEAWLSNLETGQLRPRRGQVEKLEKELGLPDNTLINVYDDLVPEHPVERYDTYEGLERRATSIIDYEALAIPGWLQTEETARALLVAGRPGDDPEVIDDLVARRMKRGRALF